MWYDHDMSSGVFCPQPRALTGKVPGVDDMEENDTLALAFLEVS